MTKEFKSFFKIVGGNEGTLCKYNTRLDTYGCGCQHDCSFCYAKSLLDFRKLWNAKEPSVANIDSIARRIKKLEKGSIVRLGGMTDCFQPLESKEHVTYETIKLLNEAEVGYLIVTKSHLVGLDEYLEVMNPKLAHIQISVTSTDDIRALKYEKATLSSKRLDTVRKLQDAGFDTALRLSPYIPEFIDLDVIKQYHPNKVLVEFLRVNHWIEKWFSELVDFTPYTHKSGGYRHLDLATKIVKINEIKQSLDCEISVCEDVPEHYYYWKENINHNREDCCNLAT